ncbi:MAG TPA: hypothetical protein VMU17_00575 [Elusimicrobiota bacterium]|nr:hypothetical protein [Elusimicrobiota bacterium]
MSIGLFIGYRDPWKEDRLVPIASDAIFAKYWRPICSELNLRWVPRFQHGWMLSTQDMPHILEELSQLQRYLTCGETHAEISHHILARISVLRRELNEVLNNMDADAYVGSLCQSQRRVVPLYRAVAGEVAANGSRRFSRQYMPAEDSDPDDLAESLKNMIQQRIVTPTPPVSVDE